MGLFKNILGTPEERGLVCHFRNDSAFELIYRKIAKAFLVEEKNKEVIQGWCHVNCNQFPFAGYKNIHGGPVTVTYSRDILLEMYGVIPESEMPFKNIDSKNPKEAKESGIKRWLASIGEACRIDIMAKRAKNTSTDKIIWFLGIGAILQILIMGFIYLQRRAG